MQYTKEQLKTMEKAAPDMLEALDSVQDVMIELLSYLLLKTDIKSLELMDELNQISVANSAAIAKAKGAQQ